MRKYGFNKQMKKNLLLSFNAILSGTLFILGYSCSNDEPKCLYGQPYSKYEIKSKVTNENSEPISNSNIIIKSKEGRLSVRPDTIKTSAQGEYKYTTNETNNSFRVICDDTNDIYKADSIDITMNPTGGKDYFIGEDSKEVNFKLKKK